MCVAMGNWRIPARKKKPPRIGSTYTHVVAPAVHCHSSSAYAAAPCMVNRNPTAITTVTKNNSPRNCSSWSASSNTSPLSPVGSLNSPVPRLGTGTLRVCPLSLDVRLFRHPSAVLPSGSVVGTRWLRSGQPDHGFGVSPPSLAAGVRHPGADSPVHTLRSLPGRLAGPDGPLSVSGVLSDFSFDTKPSVRTAIARFGGKDGRFTRALADRSVADRLTAGDTALYRSSVPVHGLLLKPKVQRVRSP